MLTILPLLVGSTGGCLSDDLGSSYGDDAADESEAGDGDDSDPHAACIRDGVESECVELVAPTLQMSLSQVKQFDFSWEPVAGAEYYQLLESTDSEAPYVQVGADTVASAASLTVPLHFRLNASYKLRACHADGCVESEPLDVATSMPISGLPTPRPTTISGTVWL